MILGSKIKRKDIEEYGSSGAAPAPAMNAFDDFPVLQFVFRDTTDAIGAEVRVTSLDAAQAADVFIPRLLPLGDEGSIRNLLFDAVVIQFFGNGLSLVEEVVHVSCPLVVDLENGP